MVSCVCSKQTRNSGFGTNPFTTIQALISLDQYQLVDFGDRQKFERFGGIPVIRETPSVDGRRRSNDWPFDNCLRFRKDHGWQNGCQRPEPWLLGCGSFTLELRCTPFGHLGVFVEQAANWEWIQSLDIDFRACRALNLFGYTGGTTLALAAMGCEVTHVDSAKNIVNWARKNAALSELQDAKVRWIAEDASRYVKREIKRDRNYQIIVLDPPSFGHGTRNEVWKLDRDLIPLLADLAELSDGLQALILSCHTPEFDAGRLEEMCRGQFAIRNGIGEPMGLAIQSQHGNELQSGNCFRWSASQPKTPQ